MTASSGDVLHEREVELAELADAVGAALAGHGHVVLVEGSAGIGKTRLLDEVVRMAQGRARVLRARGGEQERSIPLLVTRELFTPYVEGASPEELDSVLAGAARSAGPLLGHGTAAASRADAGFALTHGLYWLVANLAERRPLVLVVDDLHWVDDATQRWLAYLLPRLEELPVLVVLAVRPRELDPASPVGATLATTHGVQRIRPRSLTPSAAVQLVRNRLPGAEDEFCHAAHRATGGNPLLLRALSYAVGERGLEPTARNAGRVDELGARELARIVLPRLHRLGADALAVARAAAILGDESGIADVARLTALPRERVAAAVDRLVEAEVLAARPTTGFTHPLVRAAVHDEMAPGSRSELHLAAARLLDARRADPEAAARHVVAAGRVGESWAVTALDDAASRAIARGAPEAALVHLEAALREDLTATDRFRLLLQAGWQAFRAVDPRGRGWLEEALRLAPDASAAVRAWGALWNWRTIFCERYDPARVLEGLPPSLPPEPSYVVQTHFLLDFGFSGADTRRYVERYPVPEDPADSSLAVQLWLSARAADEAVRGLSAERAMDFADRVDLDLLLASRAADTPNVVWLLLARAGSGDASGAQELARRVAEQNRRSGSRLPREWMSAAVVLACLQRGDVRTAATALGPLLDGATLSQVPVTRPSACASLVWLHHERNDLDRARAILAAYSLLDRDPPPDWHGAMLLHHRGRLRRAGGDLTGALKDHERCRDVLSSFDAVDSPFTPWRSEAAACLLGLGRRAEARALAEEQVGRARAFGGTQLLGSSLRGLALVLGGDEGIALTEEALALLADADVAGERARTLLAQARLLRLARQPARARDPLAEALDLAERLGALRLAEKVEAELRVAGGRPRRRAVTGVDALTPAELRVVTLAAEGLSNPEIAQALFVTRKTVEKHLGAAFGKLHVTSRDQLPVVLERT